MPLTISAGVASLVDESDGRGLFRAADSALLAAKRAGRDRVTKIYAGAAPALSRGALVTPVILHEIGRTTRFPLYTYFNPYNNTSPNPLPSTASYAVFADQGSWTESRASTSASMFTNGSAARVAVLAMPHNVNASDTTALVAALKDLQQYSCARISSTNCITLPFLDPTPVSLWPEQPCRWVMTKRTPSSVPNSR